MTYKHDLCEVGLVVEQEHQRLSLGITESDVVLEDLGSRGGEHEPGEEHADKGEA